MQVYEGMNLAAKKQILILFFMPDDFYFCPNWDHILKEIDFIGHKNFYLSGTMMNNGQIKFDCGETIDHLMKKSFLIII